MAKAQRSSKRPPVNWDYVLSEAQGWIENLCECGHPDSTHRGAGDGDCGEADCYGGDGLTPCRRFRRVKLKVVRA